MTSATTSAVIGRAARQPSRVTGCSQSQVVKIPACHLMYIANSNRPYAPALLNTKGTEPGHLVCAGRSSHRSPRNISIFQNLSGSPTRMADTRRQLHTIPQHCYPVIERVGDRRQPQRTNIQAVMKEWMQHM